jgi:hypothetical protein
MCIHDASLTAVPGKPTDFHVSDVTAVSVRVQWMTGFNGGLDQIFTVKYQNMATGVVMEETGITDIGPGSGQLMTQDITDGIDPETQYQLQIFTANTLGQTTGGDDSTTTLGKPTNTHKQLFCAIAIVQQLSQ